MRLRLVPSALLALALAAACDSSSDPRVYTITVTRTGTGQGTVTSTPAGISCGQDCTEPFTAGTIVTLIATPAQFDGFLGWSGGACSGTGPCTITVNGAASVTAQFYTNATIRR
jgi:hypothetical protein